MTHGQTLGRHRDLAEPVATRGAFRNDVEKEIERCAK
jgi:hypothetical protein